jgi:hypothetical protein
MAGLLKIIVILLVIFFINSCNKEETEHIRVSGEFKRWTVFPNGSYWIFKNDSTLEIDSVFVQGNPKFLDVPAYSSKDNFTLETIEMSYSSIFLSSTSQNVGQGGKEIYYLRIYKNSIMPLIASSGDNFISFLNSESKGYTLLILSLFSTYYIGLEKFYPVVSTQYSASEKKWTCWFAKDIGLIKVSGENTNPDFSWSLLRYHIAE